MIGASYGQDDANRFEIESEAVRTRYEIEVVVPPGTPPPGTVYPVVYCMDWFILGDYLKALPGLMDLGRLTEPYILVGITQGKNTDDWAVMRTRDFTPAHPTDEYSKSNMYSKALEMTGGAARFATFLEEELIPRIESEYPSDPARRCFAGYSLGGLLGVHLVTRNPQLFQYYLLGSPSLWFNDYYLASDLEEMSADRLETIKKVYLSVGEEESWEMLKGFGILRSAFHEKGFEDSRVKAEIIDSAGHVGAMPIALHNGLRFLFRSD
ncbi:MAG: alpha/beta hydrolase-fold protein [Candidatus Eisenbacteria bacterium]